MAKIITMPQLDPSSRPGMTADGLACRRGHRLLFSGLTFAVRPGQIIWLRGANGSGKTSLLRMLAGLSAPEAGRVNLQGERPLYLAHANALKGDLTVVESLAFLARLHGRKASNDALHSALRRLGVASRHDAPVRTLSQGQKRRVALARLCLEPAASIWLLDEPFDALDAGGIETLNELLAEHAGRNGSAVLTSHQALQLDRPVPIRLSLDAAAA